MCSIPLRQAASEERLRSLKQWLWSLDVDTLEAPDADSPVWDWEATGEEKFWHIHLRGAWLDSRNEELRPFSFGVRDAETEASIPDDAGFTDSSGQTVTAEDLRRDLAEEQRQWRATLGYYPAQHVDLIAYCNQRIDHQILASVALGMAEQCDGLVDLGGAIAPAPRHWELPLGPNASPAEIGARFERVTFAPLEDVHAYVRQLPGRVYERYYTIDRDRRWVSHVMDLEAFRAWMRHPDFHMIK